MHNSFLNVGTKTRHCRRIVFYIHMLGPVKMTHTVKNGQCSGGTCMVARAQALHL